MVTEPTLRILSLGAGVQSTALLIASAAGILPRVDACVFADTGWEPARVYTHLDRLEREIARPVGIPIHRVSAGNIRTDALDPHHRFASMPLYTRGPCPLCDATGAVTRLPVTGGVEKPYWLRDLAARLGLADGESAEYDGPCPSCAGTGIKDGIGRRQCTPEYKLKPIKELVRRMLGAPIGDDGVPGRVPKGRWAAQWVGFSTDESHRALDAKSTLYARAEFPLLDMGWSRDDCHELNARHGFPDTPKSACIGCPFHGNRQWRAMRDQHPEEWADVVDFDERIRGGHAAANAAGIPLRGQMFMHRARVPLASAPIDRVTAGEWVDRQSDLFAGANARALLDEIELGEEGGCSPHSCPRPLGDDDGGEEE